MTSDHQNRDFFEYLNIKIGRKMTKLAIFHPFWRLDLKYPDFERLLASFDGLSAKIWVLQKV